MLTQDELRQIRDYLMLYGKKDSELVSAELPLTGFEYVSVVQNGINKITPLSEIQETLHGELNQDVLKYSEYEQLRQQGRVLTNTLYLCTTENGSSVVQIYLQNYPLLPASDVSFEFTSNKNAVFDRQSTSITLTAKSSSVASTIKIYDITSGSETEVASVNDSDTLVFTSTISSGKTYVAKASIMGQQFTSRKEIAAVNPIYYGAGASDAVLSTEAMVQSNTAYNVPFNMQFHLTNNLDDFLYIEVPSEWKADKLELYDDPSFRTEIGMTRISTPRQGYAAYKSNAARAASGDSGHDYMVYVKIN